MLSESFDKITEESLTAMSIEELDALQSEISDVLHNKIKKLRNMVTAVKNDKTASERLDKMIEKLPEGEKKALLQKLQGSKVDTEESVKAAG